MDHRARIRLSSCTMSSNKKATIHPRILDFYDKTSSLGEEADGKNEDEDDCDDFKIRRRHSPAKITCFTPNQNTSTPPTVAALPPPVVITDEIREQLGLAKPLTAIQYDRLLLSLQSPLPNEQDMAISVCTLLSNDTRHALKFEKCPGVMDILLAHAGIFNHCNMRILFEETYEKGRGFNFHDFWRNTISNSDVRELLCECSLERYQNGVGIIPPGQEDVNYEDDLPDIGKRIDSAQEEDTVQAESLIDQSVSSSIQPSSTTSGISEDDSGESKSQSALKSEPVPLDVVDGLPSGERTLENSLGKLTGADKICQSEDLTNNSRSNSVTNLTDALQDQDSTRIDDMFRLGATSGLDDQNDSDDEFPEEIKPPGAEKEVLWDLLDTDVMASNVDCEPCCSRCPCLRQPTIFETPVEEAEIDVLSYEKNAKVTEQIGQRIHQVASIIRNLSFDKGNAEMMGHNSSILRFILVTANCSYGALTQLSFDILGNIARFINLEDPLENPYLGMLISLVVDGIFSIDRFRCLRSLETVREWCREESNEGVLSPLMDRKFFSRLCELMTLSDIMMLVYSLECILSITSMGLEDVCNRLVRVSGSVDTLVSLVTVEAQSYGPKGCIQMRVVETLMGHSAYMHLLRANAAATAPPTTAPTDSQSVPPLSHTPTMTPSIAAQPQSFTVAIEQQNKDLSVPPALIPTNSPQAVNISCLSKVDRQSPTPCQILQPSLSPTVSQTAIYIKPVLSHPVQIMPATSSVDARPSLPPPQPNAYNSVTSTTSTPKSTTLVPQAVTTAIQNGVYSVKPNRASPDPTPGKVVPLHSLQEVDKSVFSFNPEVNTAPGGAVSEDVWALMWIKAAFEQVSGCSIEQGKMYRMYCTARKDPNRVISMEEFLKCAREAYGAAIGPVIKNFGGNPLSFLEGLRPTMTLTSNGISGQGNIVKISNSETTQNNRIEASTEQNPQTNNSVAEQYIPPREIKTTSPILKATLSRPPKTKNSPSKKQKVGKGKKCRSGRDESRSSVTNPTSSVIRSLLASKVTQRQQKKQQLSETKPKSTGKGNFKEKKKFGGKKKVNGVELIFKAEREVSSASSSLNSSGSVDSVKANPPISFQGILQNGLNSEPGAKGIDLNGKEDSQESAKFKGMLVDLLERKVSPRENVNGLVGNREIRISDRGLELVDQDGVPWKNIIGGLAATSNHIPTTSATLNIPTTTGISTVKSNNENSSNSSAKCQEMTFYSASDLQEPGEGVVSKSSRTEDQVDENCFSAGDQSVVLMSGGGGSGVGNCGDNAEEPKETVDINMDDADLLEKFNEISDLIVVPPEQLGLKRPRATEEKPVATEEPPVKRKAVDPTTQYAFARPLVFSPGQQILLQTSNTSGSLHGAKVIISRPTNTAGGDQRQQAYFILQPQQQQPMVTTSPTAIKISALTGIPRIPIPTTSSIPVNSTSSNNLTPASNENSSKIPVQVSTARVLEMPGLSSVPVPVVSTTSKSSSNVPFSNSLSPPQATRKSSDQLDIEIPYLCEWLGCGQRFLKHEQILMHALQTHAPTSLTEAVRCEWHTSGCDGLYRKRFSLMTHLQDRHCSKSALEISLYRRKNKIEAPPPPQTPITHLAYAPNAAFHAIRRHALQFNNPKELMDDVEGPVTKSIRLTSALILKNLCNYSLIGRRSLRRHESHLATVAMSNVESSRTISQLLFQLNELGS